VIYPYRPHPQLFSFVVYILGLNAHSFCPLQLVFVPCAHAQYSDWDVTWDMGIYVTAHLWYKCISEHGLNPYIHIPTGFCWSQVSSKSLHEAVLLKSDDSCIPYMLSIGRNIESSNVCVHVVLASVWLPNSSQRFECDPKNMKTTNMWTLITLLCSGHYSQCWPSTLHGMK